MDPELTSLRCGGVVGIVARHTVRVRNGIVVIDMDWTQVERRMRRRQGGESSEA